MKVTMIYDTIYSDEEKCKYIDVIIVITDDDVRYFVQNTKPVNYKYRGFDTLDDVYDFARHESMQESDLAQFAFKTKYAFHDDNDFFKWINDMCDDMNSLREIFVNL